VPSAARQSDTVHGSASSPRRWLPDGDGSRR
jgi:hypothetical protein